MTTRPSRPRNPRPPLIRFPAAARRTSSGSASVQMPEAPGGTAPGGAERRAGHPADGRRSRASSGPAGWRPRRRGRPRRPPTRSPRGFPARTPRASITGNPGLPVGSRPLSSTPGALALAPTHFRVQPPAPPALLLLTPCRRRRSHRARQPRAQPRGRQTPQRATLRRHCACARTRPAHAP